MAALGTSIDPNSVEPRKNNFDNLPNGEYVAEIIESSVKTNNKNSGKILALTWEIKEGEFANRKIWQNINFEHTNATTQTIGQGEVKEICDAIGYADHVEDSEVLHFQVCRIRIGLDKPSAGYEPKNVVKGVKPYVAGAPATKTAAPQRTAATTAAAKPTPGNKTTAAGPTTDRPWLNKKTA